MKSIIKKRIQDGLDNSRFIFVKIPASFFEDIDYEVTVTITGLLI